MSERSQWEPRLAQLACVLEATARKPGNVHREAEFEDCTYLDFLMSAAAIVEPLARIPEIGLGAAVLAAVQATRSVVSTNTNLGMILLLAPLVAAPAEQALHAGVAAVLDRLTIADARHVYRAIRLANAAGMGTVERHDVRDEPTVTLLEAMRAAKDRDRVARQYAEDYADVFGPGLEAMRAALETREPLEAAIVRVFLVLLSRFPDSLIARKLGPEAAVEVSTRAAHALKTGEITAFDAWLRQDGHRRNPGTTADLTTAVLYVALREGLIRLPLDRAFSTGNRVLLHG